MKEKSDYPPVVTAIIRDKKGRILVSQRSLKSKAPGQWQIPGGKVEFGENHKQALIREVKEETGMNTKSVSELIFRFIDRKNGSDVYFYEVRTNGEPQINEPEKLNSEWIYLSLNELENKETVPALSTFLKKFGKK